MQLVPVLAATLLVTSLGTNTASAQDGDWRTDFSKYTVPLSEIVSGGPPKDGIPAIDEPKFVSVDEADSWLEDREPVVVVSRNRETKAYPLQILMWHEIVNDVVGGTPIAVTYCPLCNTALTFDRRIDGRILDFGTTGRLRHSDLVMYDRQTESWWQQAVGEAIVGEYAGKRLGFISSPLVSWKSFKIAYPTGHVLSRDTGFRRRYGDNPYLRYDDLRGGPYRPFFGGRTDARLPAMERVVAVDLGDESFAYPFSFLEEKRVVNDETTDGPIVVFWAPGTASGLDDGRIAQGRDVGASNVFRRQVRGQILDFAPHRDGLFRDKQTRSTWDILGRAIAGPLAGAQLEPIPHGNHFWFAWAVFKPGTKIVR
jgi:hypothetical protein